MDTKNILLIQKFNTELVNDRDLKYFSITIGCNLVISYNLGSHSCKNDC